MSFCGIFYSHLMWFQALQYEPADILKIGRKIEWKMIEMNAGLQRLQHSNESKIQMNVST